MLLIALIYLEKIKSIIIYFYGDLKSHLRTKPLKSYYIKEKGGDPRNHSWKEVGEGKYTKANKLEFFKKTEIKQGAKNEV